MTPVTRGVINDDIFTKMPIDSINRLHLNLSLITEIEGYYGIMSNKASAAYKSRKKTRESGTFLSLVLLTEVAEEEERRFSEKFPRDEKRG